MAELCSPSDKKDSFTAILHSRSRLKLIYSEVFQLKKKGTTELFHSTESSNCAWQRSHLDFAVQMTLY